MVLREKDNPASTTTLSRIVRNIWVLTPECLGEKSSAIPSVFLRAEALSALPLESGSTHTHSERSIPSAGWDLAGGNVVKTVTKVEHHRNQCGPTTSACYQNPQQPVRSHFSRPQVNKVLWVTL